jgi:hypothetical protein
LNTRPQCFQNGTNLRRRACPSLFLDRRDPASSQREAATDCTGLTAGCGTEAVAAAQSIYLQRYISHSSPAQTFGETLSTGCSEGEHLHVMISGCQQGDRHAWQNAASSTIFGRPSCCAPLCRTSLTDAACFLLIALGSGASKFSQPSTGLQ